MELARSEGNGVTNFTCTNRFMERKRKALDKGKVPGTAFDSPRQVGSIPRAKEYENLVVGENPTRSQNFMDIENIEKILNRFYAPYAGSGHRPCATALMEALNTRCVTCKLRIKQSDSDKQGRDTQVDKENAA